MDYKGYILQFPSFIEMIGEFAGDRFGQAVDMNCEGNLVVVGAYGFAGGRGKAYVFEDEKILHELLPPVAEQVANSRFGFAVALNQSGDVAIVGASDFKDLDTYRQGRAYVFVSGELTHTLQAPELQDSLLFGNAVATSAVGDIVVVGAYGYDGSATNQGRAYVYTDGVLTATLTVTGLSHVAGFGVAVAISGDGNTIAVAAHRQDNGAGRVYVFVGGVFAYSLVSDDRDLNAFFGYAIDINWDGTIIAAGAYGYAPTLTGKVYVFTSGVLTDSIQAPVPQTEGQFGVAVTLSTLGDVVIVGSQGEATNQGKVYVYRDGVLVQEVEAEDPQAGANFGAAVAVNCDGNKMTVGAPLWDGTSLDGTGEELANRGRAYVLPVLIKFAGLDYNNMGEYPVPPACTAHVYLLAYDVANGTLITGEVLDNGVIVGVYSSEITIDQPADGGSVGVGTCVMVDGVLTMKATIFSPGLPITTRLVSDDGYTDHFGDSNIAVAAGYTISECSPTAAEAQRSIDSGPIYHIDYLQNTSGYPEDCN